MKCCQYRNRSLYEKQLSSKDNIFTHSVTYCTESNSNKKINFGMEINRLVESFDSEINNAMMLKRQRMTKFSKDVSEIANRQLAETFKAQSEEMKLLQGDLKSNMLNELNKLNFEVLSMNVSVQELLNCVDKHMVEVEALMKQHKQTVKSVENMHSDFEKLVDNMNKKHEQEYENADKKVSNELQTFHRNMMCKYEQYELRRMQSLLPTLLL